MMCWIHVNVYFHTHFNLKNKLELWNNNFELGTVHIFAYTFGRIVPYAAGHIGKSKMNVMNSSEAYLQPNHL